MAKKKIYKKTYISFVSKQVFQINSHSNIIVSSVCINILLRMYTYRVVLNVRSFVELYKTELTHCKQ